LRGNGDGTFQSEIQYPASRPSSVAVGDTNGDGKPDVVATDLNGSVSVLLNVPPTLAGSAYTIDKTAPQPAVIFSYAELNDSSAAPGQTFLADINDADEIIGVYYDSNNIAHGFYYNNGTYTTLDDPVGYQTVPGQINDAGLILGTYLDTNDFSHGFLYSDGVYTTLDDPLAVAGQTFAVQINDVGQIIGNYYDGDNISHGFLYSDGVYTTLDDPLAAPGQTFVVQINDAGQIIGNYYDSDNIYHGFLYSNGIYTTLDDPFATSQTAVVQINDIGQIIGIYFDDSNNLWHGFLYSDGTYSTLDAPGTSTFPALINNAGQIAGNYYDSNNIWHAFLYSDGTYSTLGAPGASPTFMNNMGQIIAAYSDSNNLGHGFLYSDGTYTALDDPFGVQTFLSQINDAGQIIGAYLDSDNIVRSFLVQSSGSPISVATDAGTQALGEGRVVTINVNLSEPVYLSGAPFLQLNDGGAATYSSGAGSSVLTFTYVVQPGDNTVDLQIVGLDLNGGMVRDAAGNDFAGDLFKNLGFEVDTATPTDIALSGVSIVENSPIGAVIGSLAATDLNPLDTFVFSLISNLGSLFAIDGSNLVVAGTLDYESSNAHEVVVRVTDSADHTFDKVFTINVTDVNDNAPVITTSATQSMAENATIVAALTSTDADTVGTNPANFSITGGANAVLFDIVGGNLVFKSAPDYEIDPHSYQVQVTASDGANTTPKLITVNLTDTNDNAPVITTAATQSLAENTTIVAALTSTDADTVGTNPANFSITGGADAAKFDIVGGNLMFNSAPDYETDAHSYQVEVSANDGANSTAKTINVNLIDTNDNAPVITMVATQSVAENTTLVAALTSTDADTVGTNPATFSITGGADAALFDILGGNLVFNTACNYETDPHSYTVQVSASDGVNTTPKTITVNLTDVNDNAPVITTAATQSVAENNTVVTALTSNDADTVGTNPATFSITGGADAAKFDIVGGNLVFKSAPDYETDPHSYAVEVTANDGANATSKLITVGVTNVVGVTINGTSVANTINATTTVAGQPFPTNEEDIIFGAGGADIISALGGNDVIDGGTGADTMAGGTGNDTYVVDNTGDVVSENANEGVDTIQSSVTYTLSANVENLGLTGAANINGTGNALANVITGNGGNNILAGLAGADILDGGLGTDTASYAASSTGVNVSLATGASHGGDAEGDTLIRIENLTGSGLDDTLEGDGGNNVLAGGAGTDTVSYEHATASVTVSLGLSGAQNTVGAGTDTLSSFENLTGSGFDDFLTGSSGANVLSGLDGNDTIDGGTGADTMAGGAGNDTYVVDNTGDVVIENAGEGLDTIQSSVTYTLSANVENLRLTGVGNISGTGNGLANAITGNSGNNILAGLGGADTLDGGAGTDTASYAASAAGVTVSIATGTAHGGDAESDTFVSIENLTGSALDDILEGDGGNNALNGGAGTDTVSYENAAAGVTVSLALTTAQNTIGAGTDTLSSFANLTGSGFDDILSGSSATNVLTGLAGNDVLNGAGGADTLIGGIGNDTYVVDNANDVVIENFGEGTDTVQTSISYTLGANVENLTLTGTSNINGTGNADINAITGNNGNNTLAGLGGADALDGGAGTDTATYAASTLGVTVSLATGTGSDGDAEGDTLSNIENLTGSGFNDVLEGSSGDNTLVGGAGTDTVSYANASAGVTVSLATTSAQNTGNAGTDTLSGFENLSGSAFIDSLTGSSTANVLTGLAGNDVLTGGGGADTLYGGADADKFVYTATSDSTSAARDVIMDFVHGIDRIDLSLIDANTSSNGNQAFAFVAGQTSNVVANSVTWFESNGNTIVQADVNGNTTADLAIVLTGINLHLAASDFVL